jgi:uncharacterized membrane protein
LPNTSASWRRHSYLRSYLRSALWVVPFVAIPLALVATRLADSVDSLLGWTFLGLATSGAQATLQAIVTATLSFVVFTFGSLLVAIQLASGQLTPRIIATTLLRDDVVRYTVGLFIFTLLFAVSAQNRIDTNVHQLVVFIAACLGLCSFAAFFYLIDYAARLLRPVSILSRVAQVGLAVIENVYPERSLGSHVPDVRRDMLGAPDRVILHQGPLGTVLAVDVEALTAAAARCDGTIEFVPQVGDFVAVDEPLFNVHGNALGLDEGQIRSAVAFGSERTLEQDPTFALRIVIDIALRALSAAINDPTTAVLALDQLHHLLRMVGKRNLQNSEIVDESGRLRVIVRTPNWEDFVQLAFSEIRECGAGHLQVARRLRAMIENLLLTLPEHCHPALQQQLTLLDREIEKRYWHPDVLALARIGDSQGLGGRASR